MHNSKQRLCFVGDVGIDNITRVREIIPGDHFHLREFDPFLEERDAMRGDGMKMCNLAS